MCVWCVCHMPVCALSISHSHSHTVAPGTNATSNPNAMISCSSDSVFTNVGLTQEGGVWWEDMTKEPPAKGVNWLSNIPTTHTLAHIHIHEVTLKSHLHTHTLTLKHSHHTLSQSLTHRIPSHTPTHAPSQLTHSLAHTYTQHTGHEWTPQSKEKMAHPNSRFTSPISNCPILDPAYDNPEGMEILLYTQAHTHVYTHTYIHTLTHQHNTFLQYSLTTTLALQQH